MEICEHKNIVYHEEQETLDPNKPLDLYYCLKCGSTIAPKNLEEHKILSKTEGIEYLINKREKVKQISEKDKINGIIKFIEKYFKEK